MFSAVRIGLMSTKSKPMQIMGSADTISGYESVTSIVLPSGIQAGELLIAVVTCSALGWNGLYVNSGNWQFLTGDVCQNGGKCIGVFWKIATSDNSLSVTVGTTRPKAATCYRIANATSCSGATNYGTADANYQHQPPTVTLPSTKDFLCIAGLSYDSSRSVTATPTLFTNLITAQNNPVLSTVRRLGLNGSSFTPGKWTINYRYAMVVATTIAIYS